MAVKIVLVTDGVEKPDTAGRIAQQRIRELIEGTYLGLIAKTTDLKIKKYVKVNVKIQALHPIHATYSYYATIIVEHQYLKT